jgi:hypothetical protein
VIKISAHRIGTSS